MNNELFIDELAIDNSVIVQYEVIGTILDEKEEVLTCISIYKSTDFEDAMAQAEAIYDDPTQVLKDKYAGAHYLQITVKTYTDESAFLVLYNRIIEIL